MASDIPDETDEQLRDGGDDVLVFLPIRVMDA